MKKPLKTALLVERIGAGERAGSLEQISPRCQQNSLPAIFAPGGPYWGGFPTLAAGSPVGEKGGQQTMRKEVIRSLAPLPPARVCNCMTDEEYVDFTGIRAYKRQRHPS